MEQVNTTGADQKWICVKEVMKIAGVSRSTVYNWLREQKLTIMRTPGGRVRVLETSILRK